MNLIMVQAKMVEYLTFSDETSLYRSFTVPFVVFFTSESDVFFFYLNINIILIFLKHW